MNPRDIELKLFASRPSIELGETFEIVLWIKNHSQEPIWISNINTSLSLTAEIYPPTQRRVAAAAAQLPSVFPPVLPGHLWNQMLGLASSRSALHTPVPGSEGL